MNLQTISGIVRSESADESLKEQLEYHVFDCIVVDRPTLGFAERIAIARSFQGNGIVINDTVEVASAAAADAYFERVVADGYEGIIYKSADKPYEFDFNKEKRSSWYLKRKKQEDAEFPIVGFLQGKGKDLGCIVFELEGPNHKRFNCVPNGTYEYRKQLYAEAQAEFSTRFEKKLAKVLYDDLSQDGIPLRGRIVQIGRDLSFD
jgi:ATP-dependent DNA ligase